MGSRLASNISGRFQNFSRLGIIGGMGIIASSKFHEDICDLSSSIYPEQLQIQSVLLSFPNIPDRTENILKGNVDELVTILKQFINDLNRLKVSHIVICCFTYHALLKLLKVNSQARIVSLLDYSVHSSSVMEEKVLILCSKGSAQEKIFGNSETLVYLKEEDQDIIHNCILEIKRGIRLDFIFTKLQSVIQKYKFDYILLGCTDFYILSDFFKIEYKVTTIINPLDEIKYDIVNSWQQYNITQNS
jgi:aspartate racemase